MVDNPGFWRAILNDPHYWVPAIGVAICVLYMIGRFVYSETHHKPEVQLSTKPPELMTDNRKGNFSENQRGGKVEQHYHEAPPTRKLTDDIKSQIINAIESDTSIHGASVIPLSTDTEAVNFAIKIVDYLNTTKYNGIEKPSTTFISYKMQPGIQFVKEGSHLRIFVGPKPEGAIME
jgi:hypothetical protein